MRYSLLFLISLLPTILLQGQEEDLLSLIEEEPRTEYVTSAFKTTRIVNLHSIEQTAAGVFDFKIGHRFGFINTGIDDFFGLDNAMVRIGGDYGITDNLMVGLGRSGFEKTYDGFIKYRFLQQSKGAKNVPISAAFVTTMAVKTIDFPNPEREYRFQDRLFYTHQLLIARKFSDLFSFQLSPTVVHRNLVENPDIANDVFALGMGGRLKLTKRLTLNAEYIYVLPDQISEVYTNSFSIGFDIETGGHVFQLHLTNSTSMIEKGFIAETTGDWFDGGIHFGFNISRVFTIVKPKVEGANW